MNPDALQQRTHDCFAGTGRFLKKLRLWQDEPHSPDEAVNHPVNPILFYFS
jgi:hypothetical protein